MKNGGTKLSISWEPALCVWGVFAAGLLGALAPAGCAADDPEGLSCEPGQAVVACGVVVAEDGDDITCGVGTATCTDGMQGPCSIERYHQITVSDDSSNTVGAPDSRPAGLGSSTTCPNNPCNPACNEFSDDPTGLTPGPGLTVDGTGITLTQSNAAPGGTDGLLVTPDPAAIVVTTIPLTGSLGTTPSPAQMIAEYTSGGTPIAQTPATWSLDDYTYSIIDGGGVIDVIDPVPHTATVLAQAGGFSDTAPVNVIVDALETSGNPPAAIIAEFENTPPATPVDVLYPYDDTLFPRSLPSPVLMYDGAAADWVRVCLIFNDPGQSNLQTFRFCRIQPDASPYRVNINQRAWTGFDITASGQSATITVQRISGGVQIEASAIPIEFSDEPMRGTVYFWEIGSRNIAKIDENFQLTQNLLPYKAGDDCIGCHAVSADGSTLVGISKDSKDRVSYDLATNAIMYDSGVDAKHVAVSPDGAMTLASDGGAGMLYFTNGAPGSVQSTISALSGAMEHQYFAPVGGSVAYRTSGSGSTLAVFDILLASPWTVTNHTAVATTPDGSYPYISYPSFTPDAQWIAFNVGKDSKNKDGDHYLWMVNRDGSGMRELANANGKNPGGASAADWVLNGRPRISPTTSGGYAWMLFNSKRAYGNIINTGGNTQMWISAIDETVGAGDPSHPAFWLPGQLTTDPNLEPFFVQSPCRNVSESCNFNDDCCGYDSAMPANSSAKCVIDQPITQPATRSCQAFTPNSCQATNDICSADADCCNFPADVCIQGLCQSSAQAPLYGAATFVRDYEAVCPPGTNVIWTFYQYRATTPGDTSIVFDVRTADTQSQLSSATAYPLATAVNQTGVWNFVDVGAAIMPEPSRVWLRVEATLNPSSDFTQAPWLQEWKQWYDCAENE